MPTRTPHRRPARTSRWIALPLAAAFLAAVLLAAIAGGACSKREEGSRQRTVSTTAGTAGAALGEHVRGNPEAPVGGVLTLPTPCRSKAAGDIVGLEKG